MPYVYIMTNKRNGTLYTGVTRNLAYRVRSHKKGHIKGFAQKYKLTLLVYYEQYGSMMQALRREKTIKNWKRAWKINVIEEMNPEWNDLAREG